MHQHQTLRRRGPSRARSAAGDVRSQACNFPILYVPTHLRLPHFRAFRRLLRSLFRSHMRPQRIRMAGGIAGIGYRCAYATDRRRDFAVHGTTAAGVRVASALGVGPRCAVFERDASGADRGAGQRYARRSSPWSAAGPPRWQSLKSFLPISTPRAAAPPRRSRRDRLPPRSRRRSAYRSRRLVNHRRMERRTRRGRTGDRIGSSSIGCSGSRPTAGWKQMCSGRPVKGRIRSSC